MSATHIIADSRMSVDTTRFCGAADPDQGTNCLNQPGHDGEHQSLSITWAVNAERDDAWGAAFIERHPEISEAVPAWADEVELCEVADDHVAYRASTTIGSVEIATLIHRFASGDASALAPVLWLSGDLLEHDDLARQTRDLAIDLLLAAQKLEEVA